MMELGKTQELEIVRTKEFGVYLSEKAGDEAAVLLPKKQVPAGAKIGDKVKVFIYKDSSDRLIAPICKATFRLMHCGSGSGNLLSAGLSNSQTVPSAVCLLR